jgi:hypothetical protein
MRFNVKVAFYKNEPVDYPKVSFTQLPATAQKKFIDIFAKSAKFRKYLEENISNMGAVCKNSVSHYLKLKIKKIKPIIKNPFLGIFGKKLVELEVEAQVNKVAGKKIKGAQFCQKKLTLTEIEKLFDEDKLQKHISWSINELRRGDPFKTITENKIKYYFYCCI